MLISTIAIVFVFGLLVLVHEFGHFITAKKTGMRVDEFAIGFGPKIWSRQKGETVYSIRSIPLGGFNRIAGMEKGMDEDAGDRAYWARPVWARMIVILAGSVMNFILPFLIFAGIFFFNGIQTPINEPVLGQVMEGEAASQAGLKMGDKIISINGEPVDSWTNFVEKVQGEDGKVLSVEFVRDNETMTTSVVPKYDEQAKRALIGVTAPVQTQNVGFIDSIVLAFATVINIIYQMYSALVGMITGTVAAELSGPVGVAQMTSQAAHLGIVPLLQFAALLSLNLGIINLLPIPALDGGHFVVLLVEALRGKPIEAKYVRVVQMAGIILLLSLMFFATAQDIGRLFS
ncbi:MAG TPA: RIP metalloprotease RseP [Candidatus Megamonas gallistercoris]|nr:RIP metalloprotease RseP [Candidatus Megamonas gallistercoris]